MVDMEKSFYAIIVVAAIAGWAAIELFLWGLSFVTVSFG